MSSLSSLVRSKEEKNEITPVVQLEPIVDATEPVNRFANVLFISDQKLTTDIEGKLHSMTPVVNYSTLFINRTPAMLKEKGVTHIWINISQTDARRWLEQCLTTQDAYTTVLLYSGSSRNLFLDDLKDHVDITCKIKQLDKLQALSFEDLISGVDNMLKIHSPANWVAKLVGCSKNLTPSQKN